MNVNIKIKSIEKFLSIVIISSILFTNLVIESSRYIIYVYSVLFISILYTGILILKKPSLLKKVFFNKSFIWILLFAIEMFVYGYYGIYDNQYSLMFHILNLIFIISIMIILYNSEKYAGIILLKSSSLVIILMSLFIISNSNFNIVSMIRNGNDMRLGNTLVGNVNTTAISYIFLLITPLYAIFLNKKKNKKFIPFAIVGIAFMFLTGSKKSILSLFIIILVIVFGKSNKKGVFVSKFIKVLLYATILIAMCYYIPYLNTMIWSRLVKMFNSINNYNAMSQSSTNLRIKFILTAFTRAWDKPLLGHGWGSFAMMYGYSSLYKTHLYTHNNYAEILFSFGLLGFFLYYWFPASIILKLLKKKKKDDSYDFNYYKNAKVYGWIFTLILLFIDFGTVSCYSSILGFLGFSIVNLILDESEQLLFD